MTTPASALALALLTIVWLAACAGPSADGLAVEGAQALQEPPPCGSTGWAEPPPEPARLTEAEIKGEAEAEETDGGEGAGAAPTQPWMKGGGAGCRRLPPQRPQER